MRGGTIRSRVGVNVPSERLSMPAADRDQTAPTCRAAEIGIDLLAQSFVRTPTTSRTCARSSPDGPPIVAKIETRAAVDEFDAILEVADAVMIARGDLGVELPFEDVPIVQKQLVRRRSPRPCRRSSRPRCSSR